MKRRAASTFDESHESKRVLQKKFKSHKRGKFNAGIVDNSSEKITALLEDAAPEKTMLDLQVDALLEEVSVHRKKWMEVELAKLTTFLQSIGVRNDCSDVDLGDLDAVEQRLGIRVPFEMRYAESDRACKCTFEPLKRVIVAGSYAHGCATKSQHETLTVDLLLEVPSTFYSKKDYLNFRYTRKRAFYLATIAKRLYECRSTDLFLRNASIRYAYFRGNKMHPIILLTLRSNHTTEGVAEISSSQQRELTVALHLTVENGTFALSRFAVTVNNLHVGEPEGKVNEEANGEAASIFYNQSLIEDTTRIVQFEAVDTVLRNAANGDKTQLCNLQNAIRLTRVWLAQRGLSGTLTSRGAFSGFVATYLVALLVQRRKLFGAVRPFETFRAILFQLAHSDWHATSADIKLDSSLTIPCYAAADNEAARRILTTLRCNDAQSPFDVAFIDVTGSLNLCARMLACTFERVRYEAALTVSLIDESNVLERSPARLAEEQKQQSQSDTDEVRRIIESTLLTHVAFERMFDCAFVVHTPKRAEADVQRILAQRQLARLALDTSDARFVLAKTIADVSRRALTDRVMLFDFRIDDSLRAFSARLTDGGSGGNGYSECDKLIFGLVLDPAHVERLVERGPSADSVAARHFRDFWGSRSELRRFADGAICEAVVFEASSAADRRLVWFDVLRTALVRFALVHDFGASQRTVDSKLQSGQAAHHKHAETGTENDGELRVVLKSIVWQLDCVLRPAGRRNGNSVVSTGEERLARGTALFDRLAKSIRECSSELPLAVTQVLPVGAALCHTQVIPAAHNVARVARRSERKGKEPGRRIREKHIYIEPHGVLIQLESSGKWPDDLAALRRLKAAFYIRIAKLLHERFSFRTRATPCECMVAMEGVVFSVRISCRQEVTLARAYRDAFGTLRHATTTSSAALERAIVYEPAHASQMRGVQAAHASFPTAARLAKRWCAAQMMSDQIDEMAVELLCAAVYVNAAELTSGHGKSTSSEDSTKADELPERFIKNEVVWASGTVARCVTTTGFVGAVPHTPLCGFLRFLYLLATHDWRNEPVIVNFNADLDRPELAHIRAHFSEQRASLPAMFIATTTDKINSVFTAERPSAPMLTRLVRLAKEAYATLVGQLYISKKQDFRVVFRPPLNVYDVLIRLRRSAVLRRSEFYDFATDLAERKKDAVINKKNEVDSTAPLSSNQLAKLPDCATGFDPVERYVSTLKRLFGDVAAFFFDRYGGDVIGVAWKPHANDQLLVNAANLCAYRKLVVADDGNAYVRIDHDAIIADMRTIGSELVEDVLAHASR